MLLLEDDALDPGGVALGEEECEVVRDEVAVAPRPRLFLMGEETLLKNKLHLLYFYSYFNYLIFSLCAISQFSD